MRTVYQASDLHELHDFVASAIRDGHFVAGMAKKKTGCRFHLGKDVFSCSAKS